MYLKKLLIKNFRIFDETGIELVFNKGVNAIIGENNSGKSSVIDAIRLVYSTVTYRKDIFFSKSDFHVGEDGAVADYAQFDVYLEDVPRRMTEIWNPQSESGMGGDFHIKDGSSAPTPELKTPRTKKELEDALGTVNESGKWTPPAGSHIDPKTGNILNKDGVVVGTTQEPYSKARPGSQG